MRGKERRRETEREGEKEMERARAHRENDRERERERERERNKLKNKVICDSKGHPTQKYKNPLPFWRQNGSWQYCTAARNAYLKH